MEELTAQSAEVEKDTQALLEKQHIISVGLSIAMGYAHSMSSHTTVEVEAPRVEEDEDMNIYYHKEGSVTRRKDGRWTAKLYVNGKQRTIATDKSKRWVIKRLNEAIDLKDQQRSEQLDNAMSTVITTQYTLFSWLDHWYRRYKRKQLKNSGNIERTIRLHIKAYCCDIPLDHVTTLYLDNIVLDNSHPRMAEYAVLILKQSLGKAHTLGLIPTDPSVGLTKPKHQSKPGTAYSKETIDKLLDALAGNKYLVMVKLYLLTGCRAEELLSIKGQDVDMKKGTMHIHGTKTVTSDRVIPIFEGTRIILEELHLEKDKPIIDMTYSGMRKCIYMLKRDKGISITVKDLRTTFATMCAEKGIPSHLLAKWMGHTNSKTTNQYYIKVRQDYEVAEAQKIDILI